MFRTLLVLILVSIATLVPNAHGQSFTPPERTAIVAFPSEDGAVDWDGLASRLQNASEYQSSSTDSLLGAIVAVRTGSNSLALSLSEKTTASANTDGERVRATLLEAFLNYYTSSSQERPNHQVALVNAVGLYKDSGFDIDWLAGTSIELLAERALFSSNPELSKQVIDLASSISRGQQNFRSQVWLVNLNMKAAYSSALSANDSESIRPQVFLRDAVEIIDETQKGIEDGEQLELLRKLYYRNHTIDGAAKSRAASRGDSYESVPIGIITRFYPEFQFKCVEDVDGGKKEFRVRRKFGTGGILILFSVNEKGRVTYKSTVDAQPKRLMEDFMHSYFKKQAASMRVKLKRDVAGCADGGEMILPMTLQW